MPKNNAFRKEGARGRKLLSIIGLDFNKSMAKSDASPTVDVQDLPCCRTECSNNINKRTSRNKLNYKKQLKSKDSKETTSTSISHTNSKSTTQDFEQDSDISQLTQADSSVKTCDNVKSPTICKSINNNNCLPFSRNITAGIKEDLNLLDSLSNKKYDIHSRSLSMSNLTQDVTSFTQKCKKRCQSVLPSFKFVAYSEPDYEAKIKNKHDKPGLTIFSEFNNGTDLPNDHDKSDITVCSKLNNEANVRLEKVRSLSLNDLTEDKTFEFSFVRKCQSAPNIFHEKSGLFSRPCSPSLLLFYQDPLVLEDNDETQGYHLLNQESSSEDADNVDFGNPSEGRKRRVKADPSQWKKNLAKRQRMLGEAYLGYSRGEGGKVHQYTVRPPRELGPSCNSDFCKKSKLRGCHRFTDLIRTNINNYFWKRLNWDTRKMYVIGLVSRKTTSRKTKGAGEKSKREETLTYFLPLKISDHEGKEHEEKVQVCREMLLSTLSLGRYTVQQWVKTAELGMVPTKENINASMSKSKPPDVTRKLLTLNNFLDNIPKLPSHYARKDSTKLYLEPTFSTATELFNGYKEYCTLNEERPVSRFTFDQKFCEKNLSLYTLKKDMCDICCRYNAGNLDEAEYQIHYIKKERARKEKKEDKKKAANGEFILLTMDLESVKLCPFLTASALYFKTKLTCHNFTVYDLTTHHSSCYWFDESNADLTSSTFASFLVDYLERHCLQRRMPIVIYSDGCTYQNRNVILSNALLNFSILHNVIITQKFLEPGHTQMECDSVHSCIERKLKKKEIYLPSDYIKLTKEARAENPYETISVDYSFVKNYADTDTFIYKNIRPGRRPGDPQVVDLRKIMYKPDSTVKISLDFDSDWLDLPQRPRARTVNAVYSQLHTSKIPIKKTKYNHLQQLKTLLPKDCHQFYDSLPYID